jgi:hypothetical protein
MTTPPPCRHLRTRKRFWSGDTEPATGYHQEGDEVDCLDCGAIFTVGEFQKELEFLPPEPLPLARVPEVGDQYSQFGIHVIVTRVSERSVGYIVRTQSRRKTKDSFVLNVPLSRFLRELAEGRMCLLEEIPQ